jgi:hypothetical protein
MQVYSQVGLLERLFYQPSMGLETLQGGGKPRPYHITNRPAKSAIQGGGKSKPHPGRGQAPPLHFFVFTFDGVVVRATALVGWCILLCTTKV